VQIINYSILLWYYHLHLHISLPSGHNAYNLIIDHLRRINTTYHTYFLLQILRSYRIVLKIFHYFTLSTNITAAFSEESHSMKYVYNVKKNNHPFPLFFMDFICQEKNFDIHNTTSQLNLNVIIKNPDKNCSGPPQCFNCQSYYTRYMTWHTHN